MKKHLSLNIESDVYQEVKRTIPVGQVSTFVNNLLKKHLMKLKEQELKETYELFIKRNKESGLDEDSKVLFNRLRAIEKATRLGDYIGVLDQEIMKEVKKRLKLVLDLED